MESHNRKKELLNQELKQLIDKALSFPEKSPQRQQHLHYIYLKVMRSGRLWRESTSYYADALNDMWHECFNQLDQYNPKEKEVITWLNDSLGRALKRWKYAQNRALTKHISHFIDTSGQAVAIVEHLPNRPDAEDANQAILDPVLKWIKTDPEGTLKKRIFRKRPEINAQSLLLCYLPPKPQRWPEIAANFNLTASEAKDLPKWYSRYCYPLLRQFGHESGIL
jgi:hypothetical protein